MAQNEHINESILSDEVRQDMKKERIDHMTYLPGMEVLDSGIGQQVLDRTAAYDYNRYTADDVRRALRRYEQQRDRKRQREAQKRGGEYSSHVVTSFFC